MKKMIRYGFLTGLVLLLEAGFAADSRIEMSSRVDQSRITIGDLITYTIEVVHTPDVQIQMPGLGANLGGFEIRDYKVFEPVREGGRIRSRWDYTISTFITGTFEIPPLAIQYTTGADSTVRTLQTEPIEIVVESMKPSEEGDIRDIKPPESIPLNKWDIIRWIGLGLLAAGLAALALVWFRKRRRGEKLLERKSPPRPIHEVTLEALEALRRSDWLERGEIKSYYIQLSEIVRQYIEGRYFIRALEMTTAEVIRDLGSAEIKEQDLQDLEALLNTSDLVKFAKWIPPRNQHLDWLDKAVQLVQRTLITLTLSSEEPPVDEAFPESGAEETVDSAGAVSTADKQNGESP